MPDEASLSEELDVVFGRHNDWVARNPALTVALLVNMADGLRDKFNLAVTVDQLDDEKWLVDVDDETAAGFLGFERDTDTGQIDEDDLVDGMEVTADV